MTIWNIAHRGGAGLWPENSLPVFEHAADLGCEGAELDVMLTADGVVVVHHDLRLNPGLTRKDGVWLKGETPRIKDLRLDALQAFDIGRADPESTYGRRHPLLKPMDGVRIPLLARVAELSARRNLLLLVELKSSDDPDSCAGEQLADAALAVMRNHLERTIFIGFDWRALARVKKSCPDARCWFDTDKLSGDVRPVLDFIKAAGGQGWFPNYKNATPENIREARSRGLQVAAWTVNDPEDMEQLIALQLDAICTDRPDILQSLKQRG